MALKEYAFDRAIVSFGGLLLSGFGEGDDVVLVARRNPEFSMTIGADGDGVAARMADTSADITFKFQQGSAANAQLTALLVAGQFGTGFTHALLVNDPGDNTQLVFAPDCIFAGPPDQQYGAAPNIREWKFIAEKCQMLA